MRIVFYYDTPRFPGAQIGLPVEMSEGTDSITWLKKNWVILCIQEGHEVPKDAILERIQIDT